MNASKLFRHALLGAFVLPACAFDASDASDVIDDDAAVDSRSQDVVVQSAAPCRTAQPHTASPRRAALSEILRGPASATLIGVLPSTGTALAPLETWASNAGGFSADQRWSAGDFDADGDQDLVAAWNDSGLTTLTLRRAVGRSFQTQHWSIRSATWQADTQWVPGDFDGDGATDVAGIVRVGGSIAVDLYRSTRSGFAPPQRMAVPGAIWSASIKWNSGDFDGSYAVDRKDELLAASNDGGLTTLTQWRLVGSAFAGTTWSFRVGGWDDATSYVAGDFTGDGKTDLAGIWNNGGVEAIAVYVSSGSAFFFPGQWRLTNQWFSIDNRWVSGDFNADGRVDLAEAFENDGVSWRTVFLSTGTAFGTLFGGYAGTGSFSPESSVCAGVFDAS